MPRKRRNYKRDSIGRFAKTAGAAAGVAAGVPGSSKALKRQIFKKAAKSSVRAAAGNRIEGTVTVSGTHAKYVVTLRRDPYTRFRPSRRGYAGDRVEDDA